MRFKFISIFAIVLLFISCSETKTDALLLELDKKKLAESINYDKIVFYKFAKIAIRSNAVQDTTDANFKRFSASSNNLFKTLNNVNIDSGKNISAIDALLIYQDYRKIKSFVKETDEDNFPTLLEGFNKMYGDKTQKLALLAGEQKNYNQNLEHAVLSVATLAAKSLGPEFALYECSKTQPENFKDSEEKSLLEFIRGFLFLSNNLYYLSEDGFSRNIKWLENNKQIPLPFTKAFFGWKNLNDEQANTGFHAMNCLFRGVDRLMMEREIDEKRALEDFELFVNDANKLGLENELVWTVESYLYLKQEKPEKAVVSLNKLKTSPMLSNSEREAIDKTIQYIKDRETGAKLNSVYDKAIMYRIATKYMFSVLAKINWEKVLKEQGVPHTAEVFSTLKKFNDLSAKVDYYTSKNTIDKGTENIKKEGSELIDKAKDLFK